MQNKIFSLLGLAQRAGSVASGEFMTEKCVKSKKAKLVIVAEDASDNTKKLFHDMCAYRKVPVYDYGTKEALGKAIGKAMRSSVAVTEQGFADSVKKHLDIPET